MRISEFVKRLNAIKKANGDVEVVTIGEEGKYYSAFPNNKTSIGNVFVTDTEFTNREDYWEEYCENLVIF